MNDAVSQFMSLFVGNQRSFGRFAPATGRMHTLQSPYEYQHFEQHLSGDMGIGVVPVLDDGSCMFGVIDIDAHDSDAAPIDCAALAAKAEELNLPLIVCHSKNKGAHLYVLFSEPVPAAQVRSVLARWAIAMGYPGVEVFPKQSALPTDKQGNKALGNWINLPYFGRDTRKAVVGGKDVDLDFFLELAASRRQTRESFEVAAAGDEYGEAPPCFQRMVLQGVPSGEGVRNNALFHAAVFFKRAFPEGWRDRTHDFNNRVMSDPLPHSEARKTVDSVAKRDYVYRCSEEPCLSLCDRKTCLTRTFGIKGGGPGMADFTELKQYDTDPPKWQLTANGRPVFLSTDELADYGRVRKRLMEVLREVPPRMKADEWDTVLSKLMEGVEVVEVPDEASTPGFVRARLSEWLARTSGEDSEGGRQALLRGLPVRVVVNGESVVAFRGQDFVDYLKRTRSEELKGVNLWMALKKLGVKHTRLRLSPATVINAWCVEGSFGSPDALTPVEFTEEL